MDGLEDTVAQVIAAQLKAIFPMIEERIQAVTTKAVAARPLPPFVPPAIWRQASYGASSVVRHRNGIFAATRDTASEPGVEPDGSWLPLLVGVARVGATIEGRAFAVLIELSDGARELMTEELPMPVYEGIWDKAGGYVENDMVTHTGSLWIAIKDSIGVQPGVDEAADSWRLAAKAGDRGPMPTLELDDNGLLTMKSGNKTIGEVSIRDFLEEALRTIMREREAT